MTTPGIWLRCPSACHFCYRLSPAPAHRIKGDNGRTEYRVCDVCVKDDGQGRCVYCDSLSTNNVRQQLFEGGQLLTICGTCVTANTTPNDAGDILWIQHSEVMYVTSEGRMELWLRLHRFGARYSTTIRCLEDWLQRHVSRHDNTVILPPFY